MKKKKKKIRNYNFSIYLENQISLYNSFSKLKNRDL